MDSKSHWENVYSTKPADSVSWYQTRADTSLEIIHHLLPAPSGHIMDIGGGASTLVDDLLTSGYCKLSVLDLSKSALEVAQQRLGNLAKKVKWIVGDITEISLPKHSVDLWHDRAVFHFLTSESARRKYVDLVLNSVKPGGYVVVATFAEDGPEKCSGLPVRRYSANALHGEFGEPFKMLGFEKEIHQTPFNTSQSFVYCYCRLDNG